MKKNTALVLVLVLSAVIFRIVNVEMGIWYNFSMIGALSLFSGAVLKQRSKAFLVPLFACLISDVYLAFFTDTQGFYGVSQFFVYLAMLPIVWAGSKMKNSKPLTIGAYSIGSTLLFWLLSNFGVWFGNLFTQYEPGLTLAATYLRAIPFLQGGAAEAYATELFLGTLFGDLIFSAYFFGMYAILSKKSISLQGT